MQKRRDTVLLVCYYRPRFTPVSYTHLDVYKRQVPRSGVKEFLSVMKMEGVWMYGVTDQPLEECRRALEGAGLASYFRGLMQAQEHGTGPVSYTHLRVNKEGPACHLGTDSCFDGNLIYESEED